MISAINLNQIKVVFNNTVDEDTAENVANYWVGGSPLVDGDDVAVLQAGAIPAKPMKWADITLVTKTKEQEQAEVKLACGKWIIAVEPGFSPALLAEVLKVVDAVC